MQCSTLQLNFTTLIADILDDILDDVIDANDQADRANEALDLHMDMGHE